MQNTIPSQLINSNQPKYLHVVKDASILNSQLKIVCTSVQDAKGKSILFVLVCITKILLIWFHDQSH